MVFVRGISKRISKAIVVSTCNFRYHFCMSFYALVKRKYKYYYIEIFILYFSKVNNADYLLGQKLIANKLYKLNLPDLI